MNIPDRYQKSYNLFASMFSKCSSLQQWVGLVRDETIAKDLADVKKEFHEKYYELKEERMSLIKIKVKETLGIELEVYFVKPAMMLVIGYTFMCVSGIYMEFLFVMHYFLTGCVIEKVILLKIVAMATTRREQKGLIVQERLKQESNVTAHTDKKGHCVFKVHVILVCIAELLDNYIACFQNCKLLQSVIRQCWIKIAHFQQNIFYLWPDMITGQTKEYRGNHFIAGDLQGSIRETKSHHIMYV